MRLSGAVLFSALLAVFFLVFGLIGIGYIHNAWIYPAIAASGGFVLALIQMVRDLRSGGKVETAGFDIAAERSVPTGLIYRRAAKFVAWIVGLYVIIWLVGFKLGAVCYFVLFLKLEGRAGWLAIALLSTIIFVALLLFENFLGIYWPKNMLESFIKLPYLT